jgi:magnesium transporter
LSAILQDYLNIELDSHRNQLIQLELLLTAGMFAMAIVTLVAGLFGMNLNNQHEDSYSAFVIVSSAVSSCCHAIHKPLGIC